MADQQFSVVRPGDLMVVGVDLYNARLSDDGALLLRIDPGEPASVVLRLPPQHFREAVSTTDLVELGPGMFRSPLNSVAIAAGRRSRLEYPFPDGTTELPVGGDLFALLATMGPDPGGTYVDFPAGLATNPVADRWDFGPPPDGGPRTPLWTARPRVPRGTPVHLSWFSQYPVRDDLGGVLRPADLPLHQDYRAEQLVLTSLGGNIRMSGPAGAAADTYEHRAVLGRDVHVRSVRSGRLSTGHAASLITVVDRVPRRARMIRWTTVDVVEEQVIASLVQTTTLVVTTPFVDVAALASSYPHGGREMPFTTLRITSESAVVDPSPSGDPFRLVSGGRDVLFDLVATDRAGRTVSMRTPLAFIPDTAGDVATANQVLGERFATVHPGPVTLADPAGHAGGSTDVVLTGVQLRVVRTGNATILPTIEAMNVVLDAAAGFTGSAPTAAATIAGVYLDAGMGPGNEAGAFVTLVPPLQLDLGVAASGGLAKPGGRVGVLTTAHGATPAEFLTGNRLDMGALQAALGAPTLFGGVNLLTLIDLDALTTGPALTRRTTPEGDRFGYTFTAPLSGTAAGGAVTVENGVLRIDSWVLRATGGRAVAARSHGSVTGITVRIAEFVDITFDTITFTADGGGKTVIDVGAPRIRFLGKLAFLQEMAATLAEAGLGSGARVEQDANGVTAGFGIEIPSVAVGVLQLSNLSVESWVRLPFRDEPLGFSLAIARKERPFIATVAMFGGGGYFALELSTAGIVSLDVAVEFGGSMCLDIIVASGGVTLVAGFHFFLEGTGEDRQLGFYGYVRCAGFLSVLGIVTVSVEFYLELGVVEKREAGGKSHIVLSGRASLTVAVEVLFFSKSVTLTVEREFVGSAADPPFLECVDETDWDRYCDAFCEEPA
jgi:hypothetical protein